MADWTIDMPNRILKDSICTSPNIDTLSRDAEVFFYRLLVQCDDYGRFDARLPILRANCYPLQLDRVTEQSIVTWLEELEAASLIQLYHAKGMPYLQVRTWENHQQIRAKRSKYPQPPEVDISGYQLISSDSICPRNPIQSNPNPIRDDDEKQQALDDLQSLGLFNPTMMAQFNDVWSELSGRRDWIGKAITIARDNGASSPAYALKVLANAIHTGNPPGYKPEKRTNGASAEPKRPAPNLELAQRQTERYEALVADGMPSWQAREQVEYEFATH